MLTLIQWYSLRLFINSNKWGVLLCKPAVRVNTSLWLNVMSRMQPVLSRFPVVMHYWWRLVSDTSPSVLFTYMFLWRHPLWKIVLYFFTYGLYFRRWSAHFGDWNDTLPLCARIMRWFDIQYSTSLRRNIGFCVFVYKSERFFVTLR